MAGSRLAVPVLMCCLEAVRADVECVGLTVTNYCYGSGAYCCDSDDGLNSECCYQLWGLWWFWMLWIFALILIISCGFWCRRRFRPRNATYVVLGQPTAFLARPGPSVYGTVESTPAYITAARPAHGPMSPPAYTDQKPPSYSGI